MSFNGSARRIWKLTEVSENAVWRAALIGTAVCLIALAWTSSQSGI